jgi:hypothetical protein
VGFLLSPKRDALAAKHFLQMAMWRVGRNRPIHKISARSCEIGLWRLTANRISEIFGVRLHKRLRAKLPHGNR